MTKLLQILFLSFLVISCSEESNTQQETTTSPQEETQIDSLGWINRQILENPNNPELYLAKARYFNSKGAVDKAVEEVDRALVIDSTNLNYLTFKGDVYYDSRQMIPAKETYLKILTFDEKNIHANIRLAWIGLIAGLHESCFIYANNALKEDPFLAEPYYL